LRWGYQENTRRDKADSYHRAEPFTAGFGDRRPLTARLGIQAKRRARSRGLQETAEPAADCRPGPLTVGIFKQVLRTPPAR